MRRRPGLGEYIERRLGRGATTQLRNLLVRPLGAASFSQFWRYWNPVYGYFLSYYAYRPLRLVFPRPVAVLLTFVGCGLSAAGSCCTTSSAGPWPDTPVSPR